MAFLVKCGILVNCGIFGQIWNFWSNEEFLVERINLSFFRLQVKPDDYSSTLIQRLFNNLLRKMRSAQKISTHKSLVVKLVKVRFGGHDAKKRIPFFRPYSGIYAVHSMANVYAVLSFYNVKCLSHSQ